MAVVYAIARFLFKFSRNYELLSNGSHQATGCSTYVGRTWLVGTHICKIATHSVESTNKATFQIMALEGTVWSFRRFTDCSGW